MRVQAPHPRVIDLGVPKFLQSCASPQKPSCSCIWSRPGCTLVSTQVSSSVSGPGDARRPVAIIRSDAPSVPQGGGVG